MKGKLIFVGLSLLLVVSMLVVSMIGFGGCGRNESLVTLITPQDGQILYDTSSWQIAWQADPRVEEIVLFLRTVDETYDPEIGRVEAVTGNFTYEAGFLRETDYYLTIHASKFASGVTVDEGQKASHQIKVRVRGNPSPILEDDGNILVKITSPKESQTLERGNVYKIEWVHAPSITKVAIDFYQYVILGDYESTAVVDAAQKEYLLTIPPYYSEGSAYLSISVVEVKDPQYIDKLREAMAVLVNYVEGEYGDWGNVPLKEREEFYRLQDKIWRYEMTIFKSDSIKVEIK